MHLRIGIFQLAVQGLAALLHITEVRFVLAALQRGLIQLMLVLRRRQAA
jgi:hypothetical protein